MGNSSSRRNEQLNTIPTGLYEHCEWDPKVIKRLILEKKLAPISVGKDETSEEGLEECPICFLYYSGGLNRSRCCRKGACTECYLQVKRPNQSTTCPFCNHAQYIVTFTGPLTREEIAQEAQEQQKVQELKTIMRNEEIERDKQRMLEKERLRKEQEQHGVASMPSSTGNTVPTPARTANNDSPRTPHSVPSNTQHSSFGTFGQYYGSTYPPPGGAQHSFVGDSEADLDDLMLMEAIRLSLLDVQPPPSESLQTGSNPPLAQDSSNSEDNYSSDDSDEILNPTKIVNPRSTSTTTVSTTNTMPTNTDSHRSEYPEGLHNSPNVNNMHTLDPKYANPFTDPTTYSTTTSATNPPTVDPSMHSTDPTHSDTNTQPENLFPLCSTSVGSKSMDYVNATDSPRLLPPQETSNSTLEGDNGNLNKLADQDYLSESSIVTNSNTTTTTATTTTTITNPDYLPTNEDIPVNTPFTSHTATT
jgi:hypothetical protein